MKRLAFVFVMAVLVIAVAACEAALPSPQTVAWDPPVDGFADSYEVAVQRNGAGDILPLGSPSSAQFIVDLEAAGLYGRYVVLVRSIAVTEPDIISESEWIRSDADGDVSVVDGEPMTFTIQRARPAGAPTMLRVQ